MRKITGRTGVWAGALALLLAVSGLLGNGRAWAEDRQKIDSVHLSVQSTIVSGSSGGDVYVSSSDSRYHVGQAEILNEDDDWKGGMTPRAEVEIYAASGYYFGGSGKSMFTFDGDATYVSASRQDNGETLVLRIKLDKLDNGDLTVDGAEWDGTSGTASWTENPNARYYQVRLRRDDTTVTSTRTTYEDYYDFAKDITRKGDYYFEVRAVGSGSEKGDWTMSDSWYITASEADDLSSGYDHPGSTYGSSGGPGVVGGSGGSGGPGASGGYYNGPGVTTGSGGHWCLDRYGWWYEYPNHSYPYSCWQAIDGRWYCFNESGYLRYGWILWNNQWYYCDTVSGALLSNTRTPDGYYVGGDGVWIP